MLVLVISPAFRVTPPPDRIEDDAVYFTMNYINDQGKEKDDLRKVCGWYFSTLCFRRKDGRGCLDQLYWEMNRYVGVTYPSDQEWRRPTYSGRSPQGKDCQNLSGTT